MPNLESREPIHRAIYYLALALDCQAEQRYEFEAHLETCIIHARSVIHQLKHKYHKHPQWNEWFNSLKNNSKLEFFRKNRDLILKEKSMPLTQYIGSQPTTYAHQHYSLPNKEPITNLKDYLKEVQILIAEAKQKFNPNLNP